MKILVLSDTHGDTDAIRLALAAEAPDLLIHLGDCCGDVTYALIGEAPVALLQVRGNCDYGVQMPAELEPELGGKRFFLLHGHTRDAKNGDSAMLAAAQVRGTLPAPSAALVTKALKCNGKVYACVNIPGTYTFEWGHCLCDYFNLKFFHCSFLLSFN